MKTTMYTVFDDKADIYTPPFFQGTDGMAMRAFSQACTNAEHPFSKNPEDYHLYKVGSFDDETGKVESYEPVLLLNAIEVVSAAKAEKEAKQ